MRFTPYTDPMKEYLKPTCIEIKLHGDEEFETLETVLHSLFQTLGFRRDETELEEDGIRFKYRPKGSKKK